MSGLRGRRVLVIGLGTSGRAAAAVLAEEGASVCVSEKRPAGELSGLGDLESRGVRVEAGGHRPDQLDGVTLVVTSPGVPERAPILEAAHERGIEIWSELELGARLCRVPYLAVTGTNGKSTTTGMIASVLTASGMRATACGNIGHPFSLAAREEHEVLAVEASSFQLCFHHTFRPRVSVLLNVAADHLDWHGSLESYADAKARIFELQGGGDTHVGNREDPRAAGISASAPCVVTWFGLDDPPTGGVGYIGGELVSRVAGEVSLGRPVGSAGFRADAAAAAAASLAFGIEPGAVAAGLASVEPLPHRGEVVAEAGPVRFIDDSKATNPHAALASLEGISDAVLIAGGLSKGVDLSPLAETADALAGVVAIGEAAQELVAVFRDRVAVRVASSIEEAVRVALEMAPSGGTVILAPACASQDMFRDYRERGERFAQAAARLAKEEAGDG